MGKKNELRLLRDEDGEVRPFKGVSPNFAIPVEILPITYGQSRSLESFGEPLDNWSDEDKLAVINNNVFRANEQPMEIADLDDLYNNFDAWTIEDLVAAVFMYSGLGRLFDTEGNFLSEVPDES